MTLPDPNMAPAHDDDATEAFIREMTAHRHRVCAFIAKQLVNPADVEDVFQKTSLVMWKKMDAFDPEGSFFGWACGIACNEVRNFLTVKRRSRLHFSADLVELLSEEAKEEGDLTQARLEALRTCVTTLTEGQRMVLRRCYAGTETITEVAAETGCGRDALYKQLARLRGKLMNCIRLRLRREGFQA